MRSRASAVALVVAAIVAAFVLVALPAPPASPRDEVVSPPTPAPTVAGETAAPTATPKRTVAGMRILVPRLGIDLALRDGDLARDIPREGFAGGTPEGAAFHLPGTAVPGDRGDAYIYAHARIGMFLSLWQARVGDRVIVQLPDGGALEYVVSEIHPRVPFDEVKWVEATEDERLTLQTSTGANPTDPRFVVVALRQR